MLSRRIMTQAVGAWAVALALFAGGGAVRAQDGCAPCATGKCCPGWLNPHCPPGLKHCAEGPPHICVRLGCPRPICNPCAAPGWGYVETCWRPWPWPQDWNHCAVVPPAASIALSQHPYEQTYNPYRMGPGPATTPGYAVPGYPSGPIGPMPGPGVGPSYAPPAPNFTPPSNRPPQPIGPPGGETTPFPREARPGL